MKCFFGIKLSTSYTKAQAKQHKRKRMFTIKVLTDSLPGGYKPIIDAYNASRPEGLEPIRKAGVFEGGFEIPLNAEEMKILKEHRSSLDANDCVRQLRWSGGKLKSGYHKGFKTQETELLYYALIQVLGADKVQQIPFEM